MSLNKEAILAIRDFTMTEVDVPEWGGKVQMRPMSGKERDAFEMEIQRRTKVGSMDSENLRVMLLALSLVDEAGKSLFTLADMEALNEKSAVVICRLFEVAQKINGLTAQAIEGLGKN